MSVLYVLPHPRRPWPEGHATRAGVVSSVIPDLVATDKPVPSQDWDAAIFDTFSEAQPWAFSEALRLTRLRVPTVSINRALNRWAKTPDIPWSLVVQPGPYEGTSGEIIGPLVEVRDASHPAFDVLLLVSRRPMEDLWFLDAARELSRAGVDFHVLVDGEGPMRSSITGTGSEWIPSANVVVGGAGTGTLYETLWAGKRLVARPFTLEQQTRLAAARAAGEAVVEVTGSLAEAIAQVRDMEPIGRRETGAAAFAEMVAALR